MTPIPAPSLIIRMMGGGGKMRGRATPRGGSSPHFTPGYPELVNPSPHGIGTHVKSFTFKQSGVKPHKYWLEELKSKLLQVKFDLIEKEEFKVRVKVYLKETKEVEMVVARNPQKHYVAYCQLVNYPITYFKLVLYPDKVKVFSHDLDLLHQRFEEFSNKVKQLKQSDRQRYQIEKFKESDLFKELREVTELLSEVKYLIAVAYHVLVNYLS